MADNISFRSSMNGFNRNDVMAYIDGILAEKAELQIKVAALEKDIENIKTECEEEIKSYKDSVLVSSAGNEELIAKLEAELAEKKSDNEALRSAIAQSKENEQLRSAEAAAEKEALKAREEQYIAEIAELKIKLAELEKENACSENKNIEKCSDCDIAKVYEARLGAAMLDAKRFSEILVKEANDKASDLFADAFSSAHATSVKAGAIAESITDISNRFNVSFKALLDNMKALGSMLDSFKNDVKITGEKFNFTTEFAAFSGEPADVTEKPVETSVTEDIIPALKRNVNFDDADEFDFRVDVND